MSVVAHNLVTTNASSFDTGHDVGAQLRARFERPPQLLLTYLSVNHDQPAFLAGMRGAIGEETAIVGCSTQGVIGPGFVREDGYAANVLALGGDSVTIADACVEQIGEDTLAKGKALGRALRSKLPSPPAVTVVLFDPLSGVDTDLLLAGLQSEVECPILGGGSAHTFNFEGLKRTFQYHGDRVLSHGAVAFAISGELTIETGICHGCSPVGVEMTVTRADNAVVLELDGRPAVDVWRDICASNEGEMALVATLAIGVHSERGRARAPGEKAGGAGADEYLVRAAYSMDMARGGLILGATIPEGTVVALHHRTIEDILDGAARMARELRGRLAGKTLRAVLGFECGGRTKPFLGDEETLKENMLIQREIGAGVPWVGGMFWGELYPIDGRPTFHNYSYPVLAIAD